MLGRVISGVAIPLSIEMRSQTTLDCIALAAAFPITGPFVGSRRGGFPPGRTHTTKAFQRCTAGFNVSADPSERRLEGSMEEVSIAYRVGLK